MVMKRRSLLTLCASFAGLAVCPAADEKPDPIIGKWTNEKHSKHPGVLEFKADGTCSSRLPRQPTMKGKWTIESQNDRSRKYTAVWAGGAKEGIYNLSLTDGKIRNTKGQIAYERLAE